MSEKRGLSHEAYGGVHGDNYVPFVPASQALPEFTAISLIFGVIFALIFAAANTYLGLKIGMTIAAAIPCAILATGILKGILRRNNILEANMIAAMAAMGESLAGGIIFILPAVILFGDKLSIWTVLIISLLGGLLGVGFVVPLRRYLIVEEHGNLLYPEGMAASEVLVSSSQGGTGFKTMMIGLAGGAIYKLLSEGFMFWNYEPEWAIKKYQGTLFGIDVTAALFGVGYIVGIEVGMYMFAGALVAYFVLIPLITYFGAGNAAALFPAADPIVKMSAGAIRGSYVRYIGAGTVIAGGIISVVKAMPIIVKSFSSAMKGFGSKGGAKRTELDVPMTWVIAAAVFVFVVAWFLPMVGAHFIGSILVVIFAFFFSVVSARLVGMIGTTNNPISGMTIASVLFITSGLKISGFADHKAMIAAVLAGGIVCSAVAIAGGAAQSLKTTYILGGTPKRLQIGMLIGTILSSVVVGLVILMLYTAYGPDKIPAPQANMMKLIIEGIMNAQIPWVLIIAGIFLGIMCELMHIPVLPFALGLYLPIHLSAGVLVGGILRVIVDKKFKKNDGQLKEQTEKGILLSSGLVAGDALVGIIIAVFAVFNINIGFGAKILPAITGSHWTSAVMGILLFIWMYMRIVKVDNPVAATKSATKGM